MRVSISTKFYIEELSLPDNVDVTLIKPSVKEIRKSQEKDIINNALSNPVSALPFEEYLENKKSLLFIVNDATRATPTSIILKTLLPIVKEHGISNINAIVATGTHRPPTKPELKQIFGESYELFRNRIYIHSSIDKSMLLYYGTTNRGTEVYVNKLIEAFDGIIVIGSTEPHYFAGYTGGRKGIVPGIAGYETIEQNHKFALDDNAKILKLSGNPVHEDLVDAVQLVIEKSNIDVYSINTIVNSQGQLYAVTVGDLFAAHLKSVQYANDIFVKKVNHKFDVLIAVVYPPLDINFYQSHKALENVKMVVKEHGTIVLISRCHEGIGPSNYYNLFLKIKYLSNPLEYVKKNYKLGYHKTIKLMQLTNNYHIYVISELNPTVIRNMNMNLARCVREILDKCNLSNISCIGIVNDAGIIVPIKL